eukprot:scaffold21630_cov39-Phaeocystis_antarctica.AAC.2
MTADWPGALTGLVLSGAGVGDVATRGRTSPDVGLERGSSSSGGDLETGGRADRGGSAGSGATDEGMTRTRRVGKILLKTAFYAPTRSHPPKTPALKAGACTNSGGDKVNPPGPGAVLGFG